MSGRLFGLGLCRILNSRSLAFIACNFAHFHLWLAGHVHHHREGWVSVWPTFNVLLQNDHGATIKPDVLGRIFS